MSTLGVGVERGTVVKGLGTVAQIFCALVSSSAKWVYNRTFPQMRNTSNHAEHLIRTMDDRKTLEISSRSSVLPTLGWTQQRALLGAG